MGLISRIFGGRQQTRGAGEVSPPPTPPTNKPQDSANTSPQTGSDQVTLSPNAQALTDPTNPLYHTNGLGSAAISMW